MAERRYLVVDDRRGESPAAERPVLFGDVLEGVALVPHVDSQDPHILTSSIPDHSRLPQKPGLTATLVETI
jgi:hypothetical protein